MYHIKETRHICSARHFFCCMDGQLRPKLPHRFSASSQDATTASSVSCACCQGQRSCPPGRTCMQKHVSGLRLHQNCHDPFDYFASVRSQMLLGCPPDQGGSTRRGGREGHRLPPLRALLDRKQLVGAVRHFRRNKRYTFTIDRTKTQNGRKKYRTKVFHQRV